MPNPTNKEMPVVRFVWEIIILPIVAIVVFVIKTIAEDWDNRDG